MTEHPIFLQFDIVILDFNKKIKTGAWKLRKEISVYVVQPSIVFMVLAGSDLPELSMDGL